MSKDNTIIDKLARTLQRRELGKGGIEPLAFIYANEDVQNIEIDNTPAPYAICVPLSTSAIADESGQYREQITIAVWFADLMAQTMGTYDARENERIIDECKRRAFLWLSSLKPTPGSELKLVSVDNASRAYLERDAVLTGYIVMVTLQEIESIGYCQWRALTDK